MVPMREIPKCHKCGCTDKELIHHHRSYEPEEIVMVCRSCHKYIHNRLRKEGLCTIPPSEIHRMSRFSNNTLKLNSIRQKSEHGIILSKKINKKFREVHNQHDFRFYETLLPNIRMLERIRILDDGLQIISWSGFLPGHGKKLYLIDID